MLYMGMEDVFPVFRHLTPSSSMGSPAEVSWCFLLSGSTGSSVTARASIVGSAWASTTSTAAVTLSIATPVATTATTALTAASTTEAIAVSATTVVALHSLKAVVGVGGVAACGRLLVSPACSRGGGSRGGGSSNGSCLSLGLGGRSLGRLLHLNPLLRSSQVVACIPLALCRSVGGAVTSVGVGNRSLDVSSGSVGLDAGQGDVGAGVDLGQTGIGDSGIGLDGVSGLGRGFLVGNGFGGRLFGGCVLGLLDGGGSLGDSQLADLTNCGNLLSA